MNISLTSPRHYRQEWGPVRFASRDVASVACAQGVLTFAVVLRRPVLRGTSVGWRCCCAAGQATGTSSTAAASPWCGVRACTSAPRTSGGPAAGTCACTSTGPTVASRTGAARRTAANDADGWTAQHPQPVSPATGFLPDVRVVADRVEGAGSAGSMCRGHSASATALATGGPRSPRPMNPIGGCTVVVFTTRWRSVRSARPWEGSAQQR